MQSSKIVRQVPERPPSHGKTCDAVYTTRLLPQEVVSQVPKQPLTQASRRPLRCGLLLSRWGQSPVPAAMHAAVGGGHPAGHPPQVTVVGRAVCVAGVRIPLLVPITAAVSAAILPPNPAPSSALLRAGIWIPLLVPLSTAVSAAVLPPESAATSASLQGPGRTTDMLAAGWR